MARSMTARMIGAAKLDVAAYEEVEADATATGQAATVVVLAAVASAIGVTRGDAPGTLWMLVGTLLGWTIWSSITWFIGTRLFGGTATWGEVARTLGFAQTPNVLLILAFLPVPARLIELPVAIWGLAAGIVAIRQALDFTTGKAALTVIVSWLIVFIPMAMLFVAMMPRVP